MRQFLLAMLLAACALMAAWSASAQTAASDFNHDATLFPLRGAHETVRCETCHINGVFKGTPLACSLCHVRGNRSSAVPMPDLHIPLNAGQDCDLCHTTSGFSGVKFSHVTVAPGSCNTCHNNYYTKGKPANHPVTTQSCDVCHTIGAFNNAALPANHLQVGAAAANCTACHTTTTASGVDYTQAALGPTHALTSAEPCLTCHAAAAIAVSRTAIAAALTPKLPSAVNHIPVGSLDCASSGCHQSYAASSTFLIGPAALTAPTLNVSGHASVAAAGQGSCASCHEAGTSYAGMLTSTSSVSDVRPLYDGNHPTSGDCATCHTTTPTFFANVVQRPAGHIPTGSYAKDCSLCHTSGNYTSFDLVATHGAGGLKCSDCHNATYGPALAGARPQAIVQSTAVNHIPFGSADCASSGCHNNYSGSVKAFALGSAGAAGDPNSPGLNPQGHATVAAAGVTACAACHSSAQSYAGMQLSASATLADVPAAADTFHAAYGSNCQACHSTQATFAGHIISLPPTHIPTGSVGTSCASCHAAAATGDYTQFSLLATHQASGLSCTSCHSGSLTVGGDITMPITNLASVSTASSHNPGSTINHIPVGTTDCVNCHSTWASAASSFYLGAANLSPSLLSPAQHALVSASCSTCHETARYTGMLTGTSTATPGDERPTYDSYHPTTGECSSCHTTAATFAQHVTAVPPTHIPTGSFSGNCSSCHLTPGVYSQFDLTQTHQAQGLSCSDCHNSTTAGLADAQAKAIKLTSNAPRTHIPVGPVDCAASGCHVNYGGSVTTFANLGGDAGNINTPTLSAIGHASLPAQRCDVCHAAGTNYSGMTISTSVQSDGWPGGSGNLDPNHPATTAGDCGACHNTSPTFLSNISAVPSAHLPTGSFGSNCASCHTTAGNFTLFDLVQTHKATGVGCLSCHNAATAALADTQRQPIKLQSAVNHIPIGSVECNSSGCHGPYVDSTSHFVIGNGASNTDPTHPTLDVAGHATAAAAGVTSCATCHGAGTSYAGMITSTATLSTDVVPGPAVDPYHAKYVGDCQACHTTTPTFAGNVSALPTGHMPTGSAGASCSNCHSGTAYNAANLVATHATGQACLSCHASTAGPFINAGAAIKTPTAAANHVPFGNVDCIACHAGYPATGTASFVIGVGAAGSINTPTMNVAAHAAAASGGLNSCASCHNMNGNPAYTGMVASQAGGGDQFPSAAEDNQHQGYSGDCVNCHSTTPTFRSNGSGTSKPSAHIPTGSAGACATCHTTSGNYAVQSLTATHSSTGLACTACHNATVAQGLATASPAIGTVIKFEASPGVTHIPFGSLDCVTCHGSYNGTASGGGTFVFSSGGTGGNINSPSLTVALHSAVAGQVSACATCHTSSVTGGTVFTGMVASTSTVVGDQFPNATLDAAHQSYTGDCGACHTTTPTFHGNGGAIPSGHIPVTGASGCAACHTTAGVYTTHSSTAVHTATAQTCLTCHNPTTAAAASSAFGTREPTINTTATPSAHIPIGALDCAASGCHKSYATSPTFLLGSGPGGSITAPSLSALGHTTILNQSPTPACTTCHTGTSAGPGALYTGMVLSTAAVAGDTFPPAGLDSNHQSFSGTDCGTCHTTTPTFSSNHTGTAGLPSNHIPLSTFPSTPACSFCHINSANYNVARMNHTGLTGGCKTCHGVVGAALTFANVAPMPQPSNHIPTTAGALANACENCHRNALTGNFQTFSGTVMDHTGISSGCATCHAPGRSFYGVTMVTAPNASTDGHQYVATLACETCHTNTMTPPPGSSTTGTAGGFAVARMVHAAASATPCYFCHEISGNPQYKLFTGANINFRRKSNSHYYPGGSNGGPDCTTGCHEHSSTDVAVGTGTTAVAGAILSPATAPTLSSAAVGTAVSRVVTLSNPGSVALSITSVGMIGSGFTVTNGCGSSLAVGGSCALTIQYLPAATGSVTGTLTVTDNASGKTGNTQTLAVTGVVATTSLVGANTPTGQSLSTVLFTSTGANTASIVQSVKFSNTGSSAVTFSGQSITGANAAYFAFSTAGVASPCVVGASVAAGATCNIGMVFTPTTAITTEATALLTVLTSGLPSSYTAQLHGSISASNGNYAYAARHAQRMMRLGIVAAQGMRPPLNGSVVAGSGRPGSLPSGATLVPPLAGAPARAGLAGLAGAPLATPAAVPAAMPGNVALALGLQNGKLPPPAGAARTAAAGSFNHAGVVPGQCATCHNGRAAPGLPQKHMLTIRSCDQCHITIAWMPVNHQHVSPKYPQHSGNIACASCHTTHTEMVVPRFPQYGGTCAACHADKFVPGLHRRAENPQLTYSVMDLKDCSGACHLALGGRPNNAPPRTGVHRSTAPQF